MDDLVDDRNQVDATNKKYRSIGDLETANRAPLAVSAYVFLFAIFFIATPIYQDHPSVVIAIGGSVCLVVVLRFVVVRLMVKRYYQNPDLWAALFATGAYVSALIWGIFTFITLHFYGMSWVSVLMLQITCGIAAGGMNSLGSNNKVARNFLFFVLSPMTIWGFVEQTKMSVALSIFTLLFAFVLLSIGRQNFRWYWTNVKHMKLLEAARDELWGEMQLAKKIQSNLVPKAPSVSEYTIATYMVSADEIGGDYYDVVNEGGRDWIIIGDVSGHGVPAGLIMMMVQTAIHVTVAQNPQIAPSKLLAAINGPIKKNIRQIGEDKYMTMTALAVMDDGVFNFAGMHQEILIYRKDTADVQTVETTGMWIGVADNVEGCFVDKSFALNDGDAVVLFTDGITEATKRQEAAETDADKPVSDDLPMYGIERLICALKQSGNKPVEAIKSAILDSLKGYESNDDVTFVVLKRDASKRNAHAA